MFKLHPMFAPHTPVPITPHMADYIPPATGPDLHQASLDKLMLKAFFLAIIQILGLSVSTILYYIQHEPAAIVVLCGGYFSRYYLVSLAGVIQAAPPTSVTAIKKACLRHRFETLKFLLIVQLSCIYLQRNIVPDLWPFVVSFLFFIFQTIAFLKACITFYADDDPKRKYIWILFMCTICCVLTQLGLFCTFTSVYTTTSRVDSLLKMGALFVPIFFGQLSDIIMIIITKTWDVSDIGTTEV